MSIEAAFVVAWLLGAAYTFGGTAQDAEEALRRDGTTEAWVYAALLIFLLALCLVAWPFVLGHDQRAAKRRKRR